MASVKHVVSLFIFEIAALLPICLVIYWAQKYAGGFSWTTGDKHKFNYHPVFMIVGFIFVMGHSVITFRILPVSHRVKKYIHATLNVIAAIFAIAGLIAVLQFHNENSIPNFYSLHSWLGITTIAVLFLQVLGGVGIFQDLVAGASQELRALYKPWHIVLGTAMVTLIAGTALTGIQEKYGFVNPVKYSAEAYSYNFLGLSLVLWVLTVVYILLSVEKNAPQTSKTAVDTHDDVVYERDSAVL